MNLQMPYIEVNGFKISIMSKFYALRAYSQLKNTAPYKNGAKKGHVQIDGEKITWEKIE